MRRHVRTVAKVRLLERDPGNPPEGTAYSTDTCGSAGHACWRRSRGGSLLPRGLPEQTAVEVAHRYLPARASVGEDWFDVIPLSGARVALVVGDVVGHGLHAGQKLTTPRIPPEPAAGP